MDVGALETGKVLGGADPVFIEANRRLRDALQSKGYSVIYTEVPNGQHAPKFWKPRLPVDVVAIVKGWN
jgi:enterochelin esterase-like enzyme